MARHTEQIDDGTTVGTWFESDKGTLGLIAQDGVPPYVCFYPPKYSDTGGLPHAVFVSAGDMQIQVPTADGARYLSVNKILDHLSESCECECDQPVE